MEREDKKISKFLSLVLRHKPEVIALTLDENGWADVDELIISTNAQGWKLTLSQLERVVRTNDKQRFSFNDDDKKWRQYSRKLSPYQHIESHNHSLLGGILWLLLVKL